MGEGGPDDNDGQAGRLVATYTTRPDGSGAEDDGTPTIDGRMKDGPRRNQGGTIIVEAEAMNLRGREEGARPELDDHASLRAADGGSSRSYVLEQRAADETASTLTKGGHGEGVSYPGRRKEDDENLVVVSESDGPNPVPSLGDVDGVAPGDTTSDSLTDDEPQTFDWQLSGGGGDKSFRGKGRSWIEDKPGTARSLSTTKTLAVYDPAKARATAFQQTPQGDLMEDDVAPPVLARGGSVGNNTPMVATGVDTQNQLETGDVAPTLRTLRPGSSTGQDDSVPAVVVEESIGFTPGMGANAGTIGAESEIAPTLKSAESGNTRTPAVFTKLHGAQDTEDHETWDEADVARTQNGLQHATELVVQPTEEALAFYPTEGQEAGRTWDEESPTIKIGSGNGDGKASGNPPAVLRHPGAAVRRLTPRECERLQGFLDDWTDLGDTADGPRYAALGDAVTVNVGQYVASLVHQDLLALSPAANELAVTVETRGRETWGASRIAVVDIDSRCAFEVNG